MSALKPQDTRALARGAIIAALYTALTVLLAPLSYGEVQIRFSEAFTLLPILMPEAVPALLVGCLLASSSAAARFSISCSVRWPRCWPRSARAACAKNSGWPR